MRHSNGKFKLSVEEGEDEEILRLYDAGYGMTTIARKVNRSTAFIHSRLHKNGAEIRLPGGGHPGHFRIPQKELYEAMAMVKGGLSIAEAARRQGKAPSTVVSRLRAAGFRR